MIRKSLLAAVLAATTILAGTAPADAQNRPWAERSAQAAPAADMTIAYGSDPLQSLDFWWPQGTEGKAPLILFVHGGGWKRGDKSNATGRLKEAHYPGEGYAFASANYRLVPQATVEQQAQDVADALRALIDRADWLGINRSRIVLMGHSAGAHLVALVGTDERYLKAAGLSFADIAGVVPVDGAAYDVPSQIAQAGRFMRRTYLQAFGTEPARQRFLSPTSHAAAPNAPRFLIPHVERPDAVQQSQGLADALHRAGTEAQVESFPGTGLKGHMEINRRLGDPDYAATGVVDVWLKRVFGQ